MSGRIGRLVVHARDFAKDLHHAAQYIDLGENPFPHKYIHDANESDLVALWNELRDVRNMTNQMIEDIAYDVAFRRGESRE